MTGRLYGVGVGPGDPELITLKAATLIKNADVIAYPGTAGRSIARSIADSLISENAIEELLIYPVTTGSLIIGWVTTAPWMISMTSLLSG